MAKKQQYTDEFNREAVKLVIGQAERGVHR